MNRGLIIYWSATGNTEKVANAIREGLTDAGLDVNIVKITGNEEVDYFEYDLICVGFPAYNFTLPEPMTRFLKSRFMKYGKENRIIPGSPEVPGKYALVFCTYSGPHSGIDEAIPAGKYAAQFFVHVGIPIIDEWYIVGEFHGRGDMSTKGRLGDIRGRPTTADLQEIKLNAENLAKKIKNNQ